MEALRKVWKEWGFVIIVLLTAGIFWSFFKVSVVSGQSMEPTFHDGDYLFLSRTAPIDRFDVIVIKKRDQRPILIKRVIGLPGEKITLTKEGKIIINEVPLEENYGKEVMEYREDVLNEILIPEGYVYVLGDNRNHSGDSREYGIISIEDVLGEVILPRR